MKIELKKKPNAVSVLILLIKKLKIRITSFTIQNQLQDHPDFPSMLSLSDSLTSWKVPNQAFELTKETCVIEELPVPFIAHLTIDNGQFTLVNGIRENTVFVSNENEQNGILTKDQFLKHWDGIILYAEKDDASGEDNYYQSLITDFFDRARLPFLILITLFASIFIISQIAFNSSYIFLSIISFLGVVTSILLLVQSMDSTNPFIQNLCGLTKKSNCNSVLKSEAAKLTSWLNWSEVGMFYFFGFFICLLTNPSSVGFLFWLNLCCLPFTFYSIGYQIKTGNWCLLCCSIQALLWSITLVYFFSNHAFQISDLMIGTPFLISYALAFLFPVAVWAFIKPFFLKSAQLQTVKDQLRKFKYNSSLFNQLLTTQDQHILPENLTPIILGNPEASITITMISNPFCGPCGSTHKTLDSWIKERDDLQLKIIFATANHDNDMRTQVARHMTALSLSGNKNKVGEALNEWYNQSSKNYDSWANKYPAHHNQEINEVMEDQRKWCKASNISYTPTIMINGFKLVDPYNLDDIKYLIN